MSNADRFEIFLASEVGGLYSRNSYRQNNGRVYCPLSLSSVGSDSSGCIVDCTRVPRPFPSFPRNIRNVMTKRTQRCRIPTHGSWLLAVQLYAYCTDYKLRACGKPYYMNPMRLENTKVRIGTKVIYQRAHPNPHNPSREAQPPHTQHWLPHRCHGPSPRKRAQRTWHWT